MSKRILSLSAAALAVVSALSAPVASRAESISFIRDAEIERTIRVYAARVWEPAGLIPDAIEVYLVKDDTINAFVAGGQKLFLNTGLLMRTENPEQLIGVIAHESGHIAGGHLARTHDELRNATAQAILAYVLGAAAAVGTGRGDIAGAVVMGGSQIAERGYLQYSRTQESAADQAAMRFMDDAGISSQGLHDFLAIIQDQEYLSASRQSPYARTHPPSADRVAAVEQHIKENSRGFPQLPAEYAEMHQRMVAKLTAFIRPAPAALRKYPESDASLAGRYARAIAYYRSADLGKALPLVDGLIRERPNDPFFHELRGQMLFESGKVVEALPSYKKAVSLYPDSGLMRGELGRIEIEAEEFKDAIHNLQLALQRDPDRGFLWHQLAIAYGRDGQMGMSSVAMAEEAFANRRMKEARYHAGKAERELPRGSPGWLRAQDILGATDREQNR